MPKDYGEKKRGGKKETTFIPKYQRIIEVPDTNKAIEIARKIAKDGESETEFCAIRHLIFSQKKQEWVQKYGSGIVTLPSKMGEDEVFEIITSLAELYGFKVRVDLDISGLLSENGDNNDSDDPQE